MSLKLTDKKKRRWLADVYRTTENQFIIDLKMEPGAGIDNHQVVDKIIDMIVDLD